MSSGSLVQRLTVCLLAPCCLLLATLSTSEANATPLRLVLCAPTDSELAKRTRGQLVDLAVDLRTAPPPSGDLHEQQEQAERYAVRFAAPLVAWLQSQPRPALAIWHAAEHRLELRSLSRTPGSANVPTSALLESAALLLRSVIRGEQLLALSRPPRPQSPPPFAPPTGDPLRVEGFVDAALRVDGAGGAGEPWLLVGSQFGVGGWSVAAAGGWLPTRNLQLPLVDVSVSGLRLFGQLGYALGQWESTRLRALGRVGWSRAVRRTRSPADGVLPLPTRVSDAAQLSAVLELSHSFGVLSVHTQLGVDAILPPRRYQVADLAENQLHTAQPHSLAPWLGLGTGVSF